MGEKQSCKICPPHELGGRKLQPCEERGSRFQEALRTVDFDRRLEPRSDFQSHVRKHLIDCFELRSLFKPESTNACVAFEQFGAGRDEKAVRCTKHCRAIEAASFRLIVIFDDDVIRPHQPPFGAQPWCYDIHRCIADTTPRKQQARPCAGRNIELPVGPSIRGVREAHQKNITWLELPTRQQVKVSVVEHESLVF
ncbi:hypothetical protein DW2_17442 [Thioclava atlantica]|uniref:Uncharacterized protein n=1 Tax=Thioclava atlantica TaxID=1317124 RepID=A0A085TRY6_9RHOB|nr:hypothetical protein DW2_17442 [Thioclava atlantica]